MPVSDVQMALSISEGRAEALANDRDESMEEEVLEFGESQGEFV